MRFLKKIQSHYKVVTQETGEVKKKKPTFTLPKSKNFTDGSFLQWYTPKHQEEIVNAIPVIDKCIEDGYVPKKELRSWDALFNKHTKALAAFEAIKKEYNKDKEWEQQTHFFPYSLHRKIPEDRYNKTKYVPELIKQLIIDFAEVRDVFDTMENLATKSDKEHKRDVLIKRDWTPAADLLKSKLEGIIKQTITELEEHLFSWNMADFESEWKQIDDSGAKTFDDWITFNRTKFGRHKSLNKLPQFWKQGNGYGKYGYENATFVTPFPSNVIEPIARKMAQDESTTIREHFISKNIHKLVSLLKTKKLEDIKVSSVKVDRGAIHSSMRFTFDDKSAFTVKNKIVYGHSSLGKFFARYPTTFHDVLVGGKPMPSPSEQKIYLEFSGNETPIIDKE